MTVGDSHHSARVHDNTSSAKFAFKQLTMKIKTLLALSEAASGPPHIDGGLREYVQPASMLASRVPSFLKTHDSADVIQARFRSNAKTTRADVRLIN